MRGRTPYAGKLALAAMLTALSLVVLWAAAMVPWGRIGLVAVAGLMPAAAVISAGKSPAVDDQVAFIKIYGVPAAVTVVPAFKAAAVDGRRAAFYQNSFG